MLPNPVFEEKLKCKNDDQVFAHLIGTLKDTITKWDYFVNWAKVQKHSEDIEITLNLLNYLIGKEDIEAEAVNLINNHPQIIPTIPVLLAIRDNKFKLLQDYTSGNFVYDEYDFSSDSSISPEKAVEFMVKSGLIQHFKTQRIKSIVDYVFGVEVGLDSNGRKNRSGTAMEDIVEFFVADVCDRHGYEYMTQATAKMLENEWGHTVTIDKASRSFDFAIDGPSKLVIIETNFYGGGGSKLKATAGEYRGLHQQLESDEHQFVWITDGAGWRNTQGPLRETFDAIDYILNLDMLEKNILEELIV